MVQQTFSLTTIMFAIFLYRSLYPPRSTVSEFVPLLNESYDYIIVGSGSAGSVLANRLSEDEGVTVLLLEAGGDDRDHVVTRSTYASIEAARDPLISRSFYSEPQSNALSGLQGGRSHCPRGMVLGGTSSVNGLMYVRGSRHDYDRWASYTGDVSWDYRHILPYFIKAESMTDDNLKNSPYHGTGGPQRVSFTGRASGMGKKIAEAWQEAGYAFNEDYNGQSMEGVAFAQGNIFKDERDSCATSYIHPILKRPNLDVSIYSFVTRVIFNSKKKAAAVEVIKHNKKVRVRAKKEIILSAGAIQSPQILMLSGIGPKAHLKTLGIPVVVDLPVGQNLQDHVSYRIQISLQAHFGNDDVRHAVENLMFTSTTEETKAKDWPDLGIHFISANLDAEQMKSLVNFDPKHMDEVTPFREQTPYGFICAPSLLRPESRGNLTLKSRDPFDDPVLFMNYLDKKADIDLLLRGRHVCLAGLKTKALKDAGAKLADPMPINLCKEHEPDSKAYWECYIRAALVTTFHHSATCPMGKADDPNAVVDRKLKVKGVNGLRVVDASIMPFIPSANTHAPTVMLAEKAADIISGRPALKPLIL